MAKFRSKQTFTLTSTANAYATERLTFDTAVNTICPEIDVFTALAVQGATPATGAVVELWLPVVVPSTRPVPDAEYYLFGTLATLATGTAGYAQGFSQALASWRGAQVRVKSGGTAGTVDVSATAN